ncbi:CD109 antigen-like isoform X2 [Panonychus citri]|uniref:CD109 antigen-like isoform X2 n=1 Tax=Panonychus citri TaxID=50023 RepID=UPI002306FFBF|nr:CD109 antigen-like isoform X2 [Panonychus citri]
MFYLKIFSSMLLPIFFLIFFSHHGLTQDLFSYTILAPEKIRANSDYFISISTHNNHGPINFDATISGHENSSHLNTISQSVTLNDDETRLVRFGVGPWGAGNYKLTVNGQGNGLTFKNETKLVYESKSFSVFIQTDKAIYKPGQKVFFRAIIVRPTLATAETGANTVYIEDAKSNRIKQWDRVFTSFGVLSFDFQLSENPVLGDWTINVDIDSKIFKKTFTVAEYVLPTFSVDVNLPSYVTYNKSDLIVNVKATYTYGKPVTGEVTLTVQPRIRYGSLTTRPLEQYQVKAKLDGSVDIPVDVIRDVRLAKDFYDREIEFFALVEEDLTGRKYNKTSILTVYDKEINIELIKSSPYYKPNLTMTCYLKVAYRDDTPVEDNGPPVKIMYGYGYNEEEYTNVIEQVPKKGIIKFEFTPISSPTSIIGIKSEYKGQTYHFMSLDMFHSQSSKFIQVGIAENSKPKIGEFLSLNVATTEPIDHFVAIVMSKGEICLTQTFFVKSGQQHVFQFLVTHSMAPKSRLVVYYVRPSDKEVIVDSLSFDVDGIFRTNVEIEASNTKAKPGEKIDITVKTNPNTYVGVLGLDQSVLLLKSGNDITRDDVIAELATYDSNYNSDSTDPFKSIYRNSFPSESSAASTFHSAGLIVLSNGIVYDYITPLYYRSSFAVSFASAYDDGVPGGPAPESVKTISQPNFPGISQVATVKVRKYFPETWLWENVTTSGTSGLANFSSIIPDTITTWSISAFAVDKRTGLGVVERPTKITVFRPFFVSLNLPYSIIRGETVAIQVLVFNYLTKPKEAQVTLFNEDKEFNFTVASNEIDTYLSDESRSQFVQVAGESAASVTFLISTNRVGTIKLKVTALADTVGDGITKQLLVKPEGKTQHLNRALLLDYSKSEDSSKDNHLVPLWMPNNAIPGSKRLSVSVIGDVLGTSLNNLDDLLKMPYGCGEQNMLNLVPNIVVLWYLKNAGKLTVDIQSKAIQHMEIGYQRELTYKRSDGSFSAFGEADKKGSTWLTAFVLKTFHQAKEYITVDTDVLKRATEFLIEQQAPDGSFKESGEIHHKPMQGGSAESSGTLSAFVMIALLQDEHFRHSYPQTFLKAENFFSEMLKSSQSSYETNILTYVLILMRSSIMESALDKSVDKMKIEGDVSYWTDETEKLDITNKQSSHFFLPKSTDIEASSYGLLSFIEKNKIADALPVMKWLISRQNAQGGFSSTQDTVIALQALASIASHLKSSKLAIDVTFKFGKISEKQTSRTFVLNPENAQVLQKFEMTDAKGETIPEDVQIESSGVGIAIVQVSWSYNLAVSAEEPAFYLNPLLGKASTDNFLQLNLCTYYKAGNSTNMAVMEVELPSGYSADVDALPSIKSQGNGIKRIESHNGDTNVVIYFDRITREELCLTVPAHRTQKVANNKPVPVILYDYYNRHESARIMYEPKVTTTCSICTSSDCQCNNDDENGIKGTSANHKSSSSPSATTTRATMLTVIFILQLVSFVCII